MIFYLLLIATLSIATEGLRKKSVSVHTSHAFASTYTEKRRTENPPASKRRYFPILCGSLVRAARVGWDENDAKRSVWAPFMANIVEVQFMKARTVGEVLCARDWWLPDFSRIWGVAEKPHKCVRIPCLHFLKDSIIFLVSSSVALKKNPPHFNLDTRGEFGISLGSIQSVQQSPASKWYDTIIQMYIDPLKKPVFNKFQAKHKFYFFFGTKHLYILRNREASPRRTAENEEEERHFHCEGPHMFFPTDAVDRKFCFIVLFPKWEGATLIARRLPVPSHWWRVEFCEYLWVCINFNKTTRLISDIKKNVSLGVWEDTFGAK